MGSERTVAVCLFVGGAVLFAIGASRPVLFIPAAVAFVAGFIVLGRGSTRPPSK